MALRRLARTADGAARRGLAKAEAAFAAPALQAFQHGHTKLARAFRRRVEFLRGAARRFRAIDESGEQP